MYDKLKHQRAPNSSSCDAMNIQSSSKSPIPSSHHAPLIFESSLTCDDCKFDEHLELSTCRGIFSTEDDLEVPHKA